MNICAYLEKTGKKQAELASESGISRSQINDICKGRRSVTAAVACKLESVSGIPWHEWMEPPREAAA